MQSYHIGLDIGSTTVKVVLLDKDENIVFSNYLRHYSQTRPWVSKILIECLESLKDKNLEECSFTLTLSGSGAIDLSKELNIDFVQEVIASTTAIQSSLPLSDVCIELGGEDAKIIFLSNGIEQRMNEACAGGTGAFIDQMAEFLHTDASGLNALARNHKTIYPIASRCGVFAKTDILPLLNEGCAKEDIAASIFQAVVDQVIGGLACGRDIGGNVLFLGGPLTFLDMLRQRFIDTLKVPDEAVFFPENSQYYVALGSALYAAHKQSTNNVQIYTANAIEAFAHKLLQKRDLDRSTLLEPLFFEDDERELFLDRFKTQYQVKERDIDSLKGKDEVKLFLGIDAGSTTIKGALMTEENELVYSYYASHQGEPLNFAIQLLKEIYTKLPENCTIIASGATGYGSTLLRQALRLSTDEVETLAHFKAAKFFLPEVTYILDIGGQDIKCMQIENDMVQNIRLNEACSAGCGTFIETFAKSLNISLEDFIDAAQKATHPVDLGTRCTVFMNSKVKQAQKEGVPLGDIAAGLCYSVIKNALYKVIRISGPEDLGSHIMVQGGAFYNTALLKALENFIERPVMRMNISGLMGAFGAALIAQEDYKTRLAKNNNLLDPDFPKIINKEELQNFKVDNSSVRCKQCTNHCVLTITKLSNGTKIISGNRCEKGAGKIESSEKFFNMFDYKYKRLFDYYVPHEETARGTVGIPRVLNIYENYPFWFSFFHSLGYKVELSSPSSKKLYNLGMNTIPSQALCYPAKLSHGHIYDLLQRDIDFIFYPCIPFEVQDFTDQDNRYNCPVVGGYPELLLNNVNALRNKELPFYSPFLVFEKNALLKNLPELEIFKDISLEEIELAIDFAFSAQNQYKKDIEEEGIRALKEIEEGNAKAIVLAGHPYHIDPEVHHGIPELINSMGLAVLTEDSISHLTDQRPDLTFIDQWTYHARLYRAAHQVAISSKLAFVQLVSFGCGLDSITAEQSEEILKGNDTLYTQIKIDEGFNLGAARIRIRSLLAVMQEQEKKAPPLNEIKIEVDSFPPAYFTKEMVKTHTILIPQMAPLHFPFIEASLQAKYNAKLLVDVPREAIELGLKYVNNDACYPAITVIGQLIHAIESGQYDKDKVALLISQTGGGCRATNYLGFLKKALVTAGLENVPVVTFNVSSRSGNAGFVIDKKMFFNLVQSIYYGDVLMRCLFRTRPYEKVAGSANKLEQKWTAIIHDTMRTKPTIYNLYKNIRNMIKDFDTLELVERERKARVGLVGEILLKFHPDANNKAIETIEAEGGEAVMPDLLDFFLYNFFSKVFAHKKLDGNKKIAFATKIALNTLIFFRLPIAFMLKRSKRFTAPIAFSKLQSKVNGIISLGHQTGEGWLLTAEMVELIEDGVNNVLCMQPFGCLPNHITGRGVIKELKSRYPHANITAIDYDASTSETNQINRIKLIMALAKK